jgi:imidazole glycerol-phosphate synthase subunit HisH
MPEREDSPRVVLAATGVANLASIMAAFRRAGARPCVAKDAAELSAADFAVVPGVGSFGSAMAALKASGMDEAIRDRITRGAPTMGVCAGMQVFFEASAESPGVAGMCLAGGRFERFPSSLPVPQLGWNRVFARGAKTDELRSSQSGNARGAKTDGLRSSPSRNAQGSPQLVRAGWAYFANSYRLASAPGGFAASLATYGEDFVAAAERPGLLLCQFHPELSGPWGLGLIERWLGSPSKSGAASRDASKVGAS